MGAQHIRNDDRRVVAEGELIEELSLLLWPYALRDEGREATLLHARVELERWISMNLPYRLTESRVFDNFEVYNFVVDLALTGRDSVWTADCVQSERRMAEELPDASRIDVAFRRTMNISDRAPGARVQMNIPLPIEDASQRELVVSEVEIHGAVGTWCAESGRIRVKGATTGGDSQLSVSVHYQISASLPSSSPTQATEDDSPWTPRYLNKEEGLIRVTKPIERIALDVETSREPLDLIESIAAFYFESMRTGYIHHDELDAVDPLASLLRLGRADCLAGSALVVGICRAVNLPARLVSGYLVYPVSPAPHYWAEVFLPSTGWIPVDVPYSWKLAGGDRREAMWARRFIGKTDLRLKTQSLPRLFTGSPGMAVPRAWRMLQRMDHGAHELTVYDAETQNWLYRDRLSVSLD